MSELIPRLYVIGCSLIKRSSGTWLLPEMEREREYTFWGAFLQVFLAVELPLGIITILHTVSSTFHDFLDYTFVKATILIVNLCICLSYPLNFGIYCGMSQQFRDTFKDLFFIKSQANHSPTQVSKSIQLWSQFIYSSFFKESIDFIHNINL